MVWLLGAKIENIEVTNLTGCELQAKLKPSRFVSNLTWVS